jgi:hypothetical protein
LKDLPQSIANGFDETFKFAHLEKDAKEAEEAARAALLTCSVAANSSCAMGSYPAFPPQQISNTSFEQNLIGQAFESSLSIVNKIANDEYFGVQDLSSTATSLNKIVDDMSALNDTMPCVASVPIYCDIYSSAGSVVQGMSSVNRAIGAFKTSDIIERWEDNERYFVLVHGLPYALVLSLLCFTWFWIRGGVCCCCRGGNKSGYALIPFAFLWMLSALVYGIISFAGVAVKYGADRIEVPVLKGKPTLEQAIVHIQLNYPEFWDLVFSDMVDGLDLLLKASLVSCFACIAILLYSLCECCCCPYRKPSKDSQDSI